MATYFIEVDTYWQNSKSYFVYEDRDEMNNTISPTTRPSARALDAAVSVLT